MTAKNVKLPHTVRLTNYLSNDVKSATNLRTNNYAKQQMQRYERLKSYCIERKFIVSCQEINGLSVTTR